MTAINLDDTEWTTVLNILSTGPWNQVNPLLMKITQQLRTAQQTAAQQASSEHANSGDTLM